MGIYLSLIYLVTFLPVYLFSVGVFDFYENVLLVDLIKYSKIL